MLAAREADPVEIEELCRAALADGDGLAIMLKVYLDESGTHAGSPVVAVAAYLARPKDWRSFTKEWNRLKKPIRCYHAADAANFAGEFKGWDKERRDPLIARLLPVIPKHVLWGVGVGIQRKAYDDALKAHPEFRALLSAGGTLYGFCFHWTILTILMEKADFLSGERIAFFHETNDFKEEALRSFGHLKEAWNPLNSEMSLTFVDKDSYPPLQAADVLAYETNKRMRDTKRPNRRSFDALQTENVTFKCYDEKNMAWAVRRLEGMRDGNVIPGDVARLDDPVWGQVS